MGPMLEKLYPYAPVWLQNLGISLYGLAWRNERLGGRFERYVADFQERDRWSPQQMQAYVDDRLRSVLLHAYEQVPRYRQIWENVGLVRSDLEHMTTSGLSRIPITPKLHLRRAPTDFLARDTASNHRLHHYRTSGSSGTPVTHICTSDDHRRFIAAREVRSFGWAGTSLRKSRSMIGGRIVVPKGLGKPPFHRYNLAERQIYLSAYHIAPHHVQDYVYALNRYRPRVMTGYAYSHYLLARMMVEQSLTLDYEPDALVLGSEKLTPEMKQLIHKSFRARAFEEYGAVENCLLATECEQGRLHANTDFGIIEIVDEHGVPAAPGIAGRILCTGLLNEAQPLIRYEIGDLGIWSAEPCACGRNHLPVLKEIVGRLEDVVVGLDGREMVRFHGIFIGLDRVIEGQVVQEALDRFTVKVVVTHGFGSHEENLIRQRFSERLGPVKVSIERTSDIPRTERGKFRAVISRLSR